MRLHALLLLALAFFHTAAALNYPRQRPGTTDDNSSTPGQSSGSSTPGGSSPTTPGQSSTTPGQSSTTPGQSTTNPGDTSTPPTSGPSTPTNPPTDTSKNTPTPPTTPTPPPTPPPAETPTTNIVTKTEENGVVVTVTSTGTNTPTPSTKPSETAANNNDGGDDEPGLGLGAIVGMSVAGGLAVLGIVAFFIWKFTRKRSSFSDDEAIKWPDLNSHSGTGLDSHPLPARETGRAGFDTGSEVNGSLMNSDNYSTADFSSAAHDPYAVPPLPHLNPNQPYRDDPSAGYDPYRGPVPAADGSDWHGSEAIPMSQLHGGPTAGAYDQVGFEQPGYNAGRASPGPHAAYGVDPMGRTSPGPHMAYQQGGGYPDPAGRQSPGPNQAYGGRMSPGPNVAYGGRTSPGPNVAYNTGYPQAGAPGYDAYGPR